MPPARAVLRIGRVRNLVDEAVSNLTLHGIGVTRESAMSVAIVAILVVAVAAGIVAGGFLAAVATAACCCVACVLYAASLRDRRLEEVRESIPDALESMSACFGSGLTLLQTFRQVASDVPGPLGKTFARSAHLLEMGSGADAALAEIRSAVQASELAFVAVALDVQHQSGGAMRQVLDAANDAVKGELSLRRSLRVQTAQAKLSARIVSVMPIILICAFSLVSPDFLMPFFTSPFGYALLALAVIMQVAGILLVRRALAVEGVS